MATTLLAKVLKMCSMVHTQARKDKYKKVTVYVLEIAVMFTCERNLVDRFICLWWLIDGVRGWVVKGDGL